MVVATKRADVQKVAPKRSTTAVACRHKPIHTRHLRVGQEFGQQRLDIGLDPVSWAREGLVDFLTISHYLRNDFPLPVSEYRGLLPPNLPLYASIEHEPEGDTYREIARQLWRDGVDGILLFNFFAARGKRPAPVELYHELGDPSKIRPVHEQKARR